ncbi:hypothetical protein C8R45DRAFT_1188233 [Mycena sanguinolenta]|nr:hypothetical protein C8R45DRAFT_1188233 [Mycena sanguinolenta]
MSDNGLPHSPSISRTPSPEPQPQTEQQWPSSRRRDRRRTRSRQPQRQDQQPQMPLSQPQGTQPQAMAQQAPQGAPGGGKKEALKLRLDLNLEVDVQIKARIHGDVTLSLILYCLVLGSAMAIDEQGARGAPFNFYDSCTFVHADAGAPTNTWVTGYLLSSGNDAGYLSEGLNFPDNDPGEKEKKKTIRPAKLGVKFNKVYRKGLNLPLNVVKQKKAFDDRGNDRAPSRTGYISRLTLNFRDTRKLIPRRTVSCVDLALCTEQSMESVQQKGETDAL